MTDHDSMDPVTPPSEIIPVGDEERRIYFETWASRLPEMESTPQTVQPLEPEPSAPELSLGQIASQKILLFLLDQPGFAFRTPDAVNQAKRTLDIQTRRWHYINTHLVNRTRLIEVQRDRPGDKRLRPTAVRLRLDRIKENETNPLVTPAVMERADSLLERIREEALVRSSQIKVNQRTAHPQIPSSAIEQAYIVRHTPGNQEEPETVATTLPKTYQPVRLNRWPRHKFDVRLTHENDVSYIYTRKRGFVDDPQLMKSRYNFRFEGGRKKYMDFAYTYERFAKMNPLHKLICAVAKSGFTDMDAERQVTYVSRFVNVGYPPSDQIKPEEIAKMLEHAKKHGYLSKTDKSYTTTAMALKEMTDHREDRSTLR